MPEAPSQPQRKTLTTISHDDLTLEFSRDRGEQRLAITDGHGESYKGFVTLPLWAILEIRDYCAQHLPMMSGGKFSA